MADEIEDESVNVGEKFRRFIVNVAAALIVIGILGLGVNLVWGPKIKRNFLCQTVEQDHEFNLKKFTELAHRFERVPVITIEIGNTGETKPMDPPGENDPDPPKGLSGNVTVNFGTQEERVLCSVRFKNDIVATIRMPND